MPVRLDRLPVDEDIFELALPAVPAFVGRETVGYSAIRCLLQIEIERRLHTQAILMHFVGAETLLQFAAHLFLEPRGNGSVRLRNLEAQRRSASLFGLLVRNYAI